MRYLTFLFVLLFSHFTWAANMTMNVDASQDRFIISLPSNPTTGYSWTVKKYDNTLLTVLSSQFFRAKTKMMGASGQTVFNFAIKPGITLPASTQILFLYARPWEPQNGTPEVVTINFQQTPQTQ